jgi:hypothetical protein
MRLPPDRFDGNRHDRRRHVALEAIGERGAHIVDGLPDGVDLTDKGEGEETVGANEDLALQILLFPDGYVDHVARLQTVSLARVTRRGHGRADRILPPARKGEQRGQQCYDDPPEGAHRNSFPCHATHRAAWCAL